MIEQESFEEDNPGIEINFRPLTRRLSKDAPLIGRNSWYNDMCRRIPDTNTGKFKDIFRNPYEDGRPLTYFLYPGLSWDKLEGFLHRQNATIECIERAEVNLENYNYQRMVYIERKRSENGKHKEVGIIQSGDHIGKSNQSGEEDADSQSGYDQVSQLEDGQESSESEHERSKTMSSEESQSESEVEYNVLQNEELHGDLELDKYILQVHEEENIQTEVRHGRETTTINDSTCLHLQPLSENSERVNDIRRMLTEPASNHGEALSKGIADQPVENGMHSDLHVLLEGDDTHAKHTASPNALEVKEENHNEFQMDTQFGSIITNDFTDRDDKNHTEGDNRRKPDNYDNQRTNGNTTNKPEDEVDNQPQDESNNPQDEVDNQSEDKEINQREDEEDNQSESDLSSQSDGTFGSCHSDKENDISDEEHEFIGSYKSDDTYTSCHSDEVFTGSFEETTQQGDGQPPIRIIKSRKSPSLFRPK